MKHLLIILAISFITVCISAFLGFSENGGLFGTIIAVGYYAASVNGGAA